MRTNEDLKTNLTTAAKTTIKISIMYLKMKEKKRCIEKKRRFYEKLSKEFSSAIKEQAELMNIMIERNDRSEISNNGECLLEFHNAINRIAQLLHQNANLQLLLIKNEKSCEKLNKWHNNSKHPYVVLSDFIKTLTDEHLKNYAILLTGQNERRENSDEMNEIPITKISLLNVSDFENK